MSVPDPPPEIARYLDSLDTRTGPRPHTVSITPAAHPDTFDMSCSCGKLKESNAYKWVVLAAQRHYVELGFTREGRGLVVDTIAGNGLAR